VQRLVERQRSPGETVCERFAFDVLEHQIALAARFFEPIDRGDVRVIQRGEQASLALEARETLGVACEVLG